MLRRLMERFTLTDIFMWFVGGSIVTLVVVGSYATLSQGTYTARHWFDFLVFGLAQGSVYALIALGYTLVYGILRMINFAHSEVFMSGAYIGFFVITAMSESGFLAENPLIALLSVFLVAMITSVTIAVLLERIAYRPLRRSPRLVPLITAIGASLFISNSVRGLYGEQVKALMPGMKPM